MSRRIVYLFAGLALVLLGFGLGYGSSRHRNASGNLLPTKPVSRASSPTRSAPTTALPRPPVTLNTTSTTSGSGERTTTPTTIGSGDATLHLTKGAAGQFGGVVVLQVPSSAPEECSPADVTLGVGQSAVAECRSANYGGPISATATNPAIALVRTSAGKTLPRYFYVTGLKIGTTTILVSYPHGPTSRYRVTVHPTSGG
jgi:hypothetical protein